MGQFNYKGEQFYLNGEPITEPPKEKWGVECFAENIRW